jgi:hypothetical protein
MAAMDPKDLPLLPPLADMPEALRDVRDERRRRFAWFYVFNGANGSAAAVAAGYSDVAGGAKVQAHHVLQRDDVQNAIKALTTRYLFSLAPKAVLRLEELLDNPKHPKHDKAIEMTLSRSGHGEKSQVDVNVSGSVTLNHTDTALEDLRRLVELGAPREKLIEAFGVSGLIRYEGMLAEKVSRETKVIEHKESEFR